MSPLGFRWIFRNPFHERALEREVEDEIAFHLHEKVRDLTARGMDPTEARREAELQFGDLRRWRRETLAASHRRRRRKRQTDALGTLRQDLAGALRHLRRRPRLAAFAVLILGLGTGSGTSVFAVLDTVLFRPMSFPEADRVVGVQGSTTRYPGLTVSPANYFDWKAGQRSFSAMAATRASTVTLYTGRPERLGSLAVESAFFDVIGVQPALGRRILPEDDQPGSERVAVISHATWRRLFGADPDVLGRRVDGSAGPVTIVGVMPADFQYFDVPFWGGPDRDVFLSDAFGDDRTSRTTGGYLWVKARLLPGVSLEQAERQMKDVAAQLAEAYPGIDGPSPDDSALSIRIVRFQNDALSFLANDLVLMGGATVLLLLVVCMSAAGVLLTWVLDRRRELAVRGALGASRARLIRQVLAETGLLALAGALTGLAVAALLIRVIPGVVPGHVPRLDAVALDGRVLAGATALSAALWLLSAALPAIRGSRLDLLSFLKEGAHAGGSRQRWGGRLIIVGQLALACALVAGAGRLIHTYASLLRVDPGLNPAHVLALHVRLPPARYSTLVGTVRDLGDAQSFFAFNEAWREQIGATPVYRVDAEAQDFARRLSERLREISGVRSVAFANEAPFSGGEIYGTRPAVRGEEQPEPPTMEAVREREGVYIKWVSANFFETLEIPLLRGRVFSDRDGLEDDPVVVVNRAFVDDFFPEGSDAVGSTLGFFEDPYFPEKEATVVGVVANTLQQGPQDPSEPVLYVPLAQRARLWNRYQRAFPLRSTFLIRTEGEPTALAGEVRAALWSVDPEIPVTSLASLDAMRAGQTSVPRFFLLLLSGFALVSLVLAAAGTFGLLVHHVRQRTHEIGVRRALGATGASVAGRILLEGACLALVGVAAGLMLALPLGRVLASHIVGVRAWSPTDQLLVVPVLILTAVGASWIPAARASRVDPLEALRAD